MAHYHWSELFPPHIWQRGQNYYRDGHILDQMYPLLYREGLYAQMMERIEAHTDIHNLEQYESLLKNEFPKRCITVYQTYLHQAMDRASNRKAYWSVIQVLKKLKKYPEGKVTAQTMAEQWKQTYPRRTSMLDELRKAGF